ncbi:MAG TPA: hypothetical protein ENJ85_03125, partial [Oceanithermus profundus]|nr:hypothetical protein [Oceanithermus profundus]
MRASWRSRERRCFRPPPPAAVRRGRWGLAGRGRTERRLGRENRRPRRAFLQTVAPFQRRSTGGGVSRLLPHAVVRLAAGRPVTPAELAAATGRTAAEVGKLLQQLPGV